MRLLIVLLLCSRAFAFTGGVTGKSGAGGGGTCADCHSGGTQPTVRLLGPGRLAPGETAAYTVEIISNAAAQTSGGLDLAASAGSFTAKTAGTAVQSGELIHTQVLSGSTIRVEVDFTAPGAVGSVTFSLAALSSNGSGAGGDATGVETRTISIEEPPDFAGLDLFGVDLSEPPPDLSIVDSGAAAPPPPGDEPRWVCDCNLASHGGTLPIPALLLFLAVLLRLRRSP